MKLTKRRVILLEMLFVAAALIALRAHPNGPINDPIPRLLAML